MEEYTVKTKQSKTRWKYLFVCQVWFLAFPTWQTGRGNFCAESCGMPIGSLSQLIVTLEGLHLIRFTAANTKEGEQKWNNCCFCLKKNSKTKVVPQFMDVLPFILWLTGFWQEKNTGIDQPGTMWMLDANLNAIFKPIWDVFVGLKSN